MVSSPAPVATPKGRPGGGEIRVEPNELSPPGVVRRAPNRVAVAMAVWLVTPFAVAVTTVLLGWLGRDLLLHWFGISPLFVADSTGGWRPFSMYLYDLVLACTVFEGLGWVFVAGWCNATSTLVAACVDGHCHDSRHVAMVLWPVHRLLASGRPHLRSGAHGGPVSVSRRSRHAYQTANLGETGADYPQTPGCATRVQSRAGFKSMVYRQGVSRLAGC
jgi:hypothetical protein